MRRHGQEAGFTLLEILVALTVLGLLMAGLAGGVRFGLTGWHVQDRATAALDGLEPVDRALGQLVEAADPGSPDGRGTLHGESGRLTFIAPAAMLGRQSLMTDRLDIAIGVDRDDRLILRSAPHVHAAALRPAKPETQQTVLLSGIARIAFSYLDPTSHQWRDSWDANTLPALVRLRITRRDETKAWPDLVWAPIRERSD